MVEFDLSMIGSVSAMVRKRLHGRRLSEDDRQELTTIILTRCSQQSATSVRLVCWRAAHDFLEGLKQASVREAETLACFKPSRKS
jgi:hypothetical protein